MLRSYIKLDIMVVFMSSFNLIFQENVMIKDIIEASSSASVIINAQKDWWAPHDYSNTENLGSLKRILCSSLDLSKPLTLQE